MDLQRLSLILLTAYFIDSRQVGGSKQKQEKKVVEGMEKIEEKYKVGKQKKQNPPASSFISQAFKLGPCTSWTHTLHASSDRPGAELLTERI